MLESDWRQSVDLCAGMIVAWVLVCILGCMSQKSRQVIYGPAEGIIARGQMDAASDSKEVGVPRSAVGKTLHPQHTYTPGNHTPIVSNLLAVNSQ